MATAEEIYRVALQQMAENGHMEAKVALAMAQQLATQSPANPGMKEQVTAQLKDANDYLLRALRENDMKWTQATDNEINRAQKSIMNAMQIMTRG